MNTWIGRLVDEEKQLEERISKLRKFIASDNFVNLEETDKTLLTLQHSVMRTYHQIIQKRLARIL